MRGLFKVLNDEGERTHVELPMRWAICYDCDGAGKSSQYLGAITGDEFAQWSWEERQEYCSGGMDRFCDTCRGTGKLQEINESACLSVADLANLKLVRQQEEDEAEYQAECAAERRMGC